MFFICNINSLMVAKKALWIFGKKGTGAGDSENFCSQLLKSICDEMVCWETEGYLKTF